MEGKNFLLVARDLAISFVIMILLPPFFERGIALLNFSGNKIMLKGVLGLLTLIAGTWVESAALGIGLLMGGFWTIPRFIYFGTIDEPWRALIILAIALAVSLRALIVWDRQYLENKL